MKYSLSYLGEYGKAKVTGDGQIEIEGVGSIENATAGQITFLGHARHKEALKVTAATAIILTAEEANSCQLPKLITDQPYLAFARICQLFNQTHQLKAGIHRNAVVDNSCTVSPKASIAAGAVIGINSVIDDDCLVGPNCSIGENCVLGKGCRLTANVVLGSDTKLGSNVLIHPGAVIGADGFGLVQDEDGHWVKIPQCGRVILGDDVEIGANTTIDRGTIEDTVLEDDVRVDNQVQIAHNVRIGKHTAIAGCVGIAGSTRIGERCKIAGGVGIVGHIEICDDVVISAMALVTKSVRSPGLCRSHSPMYNTQRWIRIKSRVHQLEKQIQSDESDD